MRFGTASLKRLWTCHPVLQTLLNKAIKKPPFDFSIVSAYRDKKAQDKCIADKTSTVKYPNSKHNQKPSLAVDLAPYINREIAWKDEEKFIILGHYIKRLAKRLNIDIVWGGDWTKEKNGVNRDLPHFELKNGIRGIRGKAA